MNPRLLSIESSANLCSVAVCGFKTDSFLVSEPGQKHTEVILGMLRECLKSAGGTFAELDAIVFGSGPGAFTGLRVACGIAQGLGWALDKPLISVGSLEALVNEHAAVLKDDEVILCATDARMHECYCRVFKKISGQIKPLCSVSLIHPDDLISLTKQYGASLFCGNAFKIYPEDTAGLLTNKTLLSVEEPDAKMLITVGLGSWKRGILIRPEEASPLYVRDNVAMTIKERKSAGFMN